jgi:predicted membrane protein
MFIGLILVIAGVLLLLTRANVIPGNIWDYALPIILIAIGARLLFTNRRKNFHIE